MNFKHLWPDDFKIGMGRLDWVDDVYVYIGSVDKRLVNGLKYSS